MVGALVAIISAVAGTASAYKQGQDQKKAGQTAAQAAVNAGPVAAAAAARATALTRQVSNAARSGGVAQVPTGRRVPDWQWVNDGNGNVVKRLVGYKDEMQDVNFAGLSDADIQGEQMRTLAEGELATSRELAPEFIKQSLLEARLADPEGFAARGRLRDLVQSQAASRDGRTSPVANALNDQLRSEMGARGGIGAVQAESIGSALKDAQSSRTGADSSTMTRNQLMEEIIRREGGARETNAQQRVLAFLTSGQTPQDIKFRNQQQTISDMGSFANGQTPLDQFGAVTGARQGAVPFSPQMTQGPIMDPNAAATGQAFGTANYNQTIQKLTSQPNNWFSGIGMALQGAGLASKVGN